MSHVRVGNGNSQGLHWAEVHNSLYLQGCQPLICDYHHLRICALTLLKDGLQHGIFCIRYQTIYTPHQPDVCMSA